MKGTDIVSIIHHLRMTTDHMQSFINDHPKALFTRLFKGYKGKIDWIITDIKTTPQLPDIVRAGINQELNSDVFAVPAINEKVALLTPSQREAIEALIDQILLGENIKAEIQ